MTLSELLSRFPGGHDGAANGYWVYCPLHQLWKRTVGLWPSKGRIAVVPFCGCRVEDILGAVGLGLEDLNTEPRGTRSGMVSTPKVGIYNGGTAGFGLAQGDGRFGKGNSYRWKPGQTGNMRGRPRVRLEDDFNFRSRMVDLIAQVHEMRRRFPLKRDSRFEKFKVLYGLTGNAFRSARIAGYAPKTARSKGYLLARRAREACAVAC